MVRRRTIVKIDEEKCDGCGQCVPACAEGAIQIVDGKARLVGENLCDGLGACLGDCPQGAISMEERLVDEYDPEAVKRHLTGENGKQAAPDSQPETQHGLPSFRCPGSMSLTLRPVKESAQKEPALGAASSTLSNWPVQLRLVPVTAPYLRGAKLLIAADCVPFAYADFHRTMLDGRILLIGCPKLDDLEFYHDKLLQIFQMNDVESIEIAYMEVPCCFGLLQVVKQALEQSGKEIPLKPVKISIRGEICQNKQIIPSKET